MIDLILTFAQMTYFMLKDWPLGTIIGVALIFTLLMLLCLVLWLIGTAVDSWFLPKKRSEGRIVNKEFTPAHTRSTVNYNPALKTSTCQTIRVPDRWELIVQIDNDKLGRISVSQEAYEYGTNATPVYVEYALGRLSGDVYISTLSFQP